LKTFLEILLVSGWKIIKNSFSVLRIGEILNKNEHFNIVS
jgi:hypothetical protein